MSDLEEDKSQEAKNKELQLLELFYETQKFSCSMKQHLLLTEKMKNLFKELWIKYQRQELQSQSPIESRQLCTQIKSLSWIKEK